MILQTSQLSALIGMAAAANAHFVLQYPNSLGFNDDAETTAPCDAFDATNRTGASSFPLSGEAIQILTTHPDVVFDFNVALVSDLNTWVSLGNIHQLGVGTFCFGSILGYAPWIGQPAVLQLIQHAPDGLLYQCAPITFTIGSPDAGPSTCINSTGTSAIWISAGNGGSASSSSAISSTSAGSTASKSSTSGIATVASSAGSSTSALSSTSAGSTASTSSTTSTTAMTSSAGSSASTATGTAAGSGTTTATAGGSNSTLKATSTTSSSVAQFTGGAKKKQAGSFVGILGAAFGALLVL